MQSLPYANVCSDLIQLLRVEDIAQPPEQPPYASTSRDVKPLRIKATYCTCFVPNCPSSTQTTPEKLFAIVPSQPEKRRLWMECVKREDKCDYKRTYRCCQDHFDLKQDMVNFASLFSERKPRRLVLKEDVVPHIFVCDYFAHLNRTGRVKVLRRLYTPKAYRKTMPIETVLLD